MDFKTSYFDSIRLRNELLSRIGEYLSMPRKLDGLAAQNAAMLKSVVAPVAANAVILKTRIDSLRSQIESRIAFTQKLSNSILLLKDTVEKDATLKKLITGEIGLTSFAINALLDKTLTSYKPYLDKAVEYSKASVATLKDLEAINASMKTLTRNVEDTYTASVGRGAVPSLKEAAASAAGEMFGVPKGVLVTGGLAIVGMLAILIKRKK